MNSLMSRLLILSLILGVVLPVGYRIKRAISHEQYYDCIKWVDESKVTTDPCAYILK